MRATATATVDGTFSEAVAALPRGLGVLGRYVLLELIGQGGMGVVWKAHDPVLDRQVALKLLVANSAVGGNLVSEAQAMARLQHPNVVVVHDAGIHAAGEHQLAYVAMELVAGRTLAAWLGEPHSVADKLDMFVRAGRGLAAAHEAGLVHRDFKPANVLLGDDGRVRVSDFGLSLLGGADDAEVPAIAGTPRYMSPGQLHGLPPDARSDQFAFCVALYQAMFGAAPFQVPAGASVAELRARILTVPEPPVLSGLAGRVAPIVVRGLSAEPAQRWPSMTELLAALEAARRPRGRRVAIAAATAAVVLTAGVVTWRYLADPTRACTSAGDGVAALWRPDRRAALASAFAKLPGGRDAWGRVEETLTDWASRWSTLRVEQCEADRNGERVSPSLTARRACLDRRLGELDGLLRALDTPDATVVTFASGAAHGLTQPEGCASAAPPLAGRPAPPLGPGVADAYAHIDRAAALSRLGKEMPALDEAKRGADAAARIDWAPLTADAQTTLGVALIHVRETARALEAFYAALWAAEKARDDGLRFEATLGLSKANQSASDYPMAGRWHKTAAAIAEHLPADAERQARLVYDEMDLAVHEGRYSDCLHTGEAGLPLAETVGRETPIVVDVLITLSQCERSLDGRISSAKRHLERALALAEKIHGHDHQQTSMILSELGIIARRAHQYDAALAHYNEALAIRARLVGPENPDCAGLHNNIANVYRDLARYDDARAELNRALGIWTKTYGPDSPAVSMGLRNLGRIAVLEGHLDQAEPLFRRMLAISRSKRPPGHPDISANAGILGECLLDQHKAEALPLLEEQLTLLEHDQDAAAPAIAGAKFMVGRARFELGIRAAGARELAASACAEIVDPDYQDDAAECHAWLDHHPAVRGSRP